MSEAIAGFPSPAPPNALDAAVAVVIRFTDSEVEVLWVRREARLSFGGGFYAFPGGRTEDEDARIEVLGANGLEATLRATAVRELFEETGLLLARGQSMLSPQARGEMRRGLLNHGSSFGELLRRRGLTLSAGELHDAGRWITPEFLPRRFDARFFLLEAPERAEVEQWPGEHSEISWVRPAEALARWERGTALLHPPTLHALRVLSAFKSIEKAASQMRAAPDCVDFIAQRIEFQRGICLVAVRTPTLPPATHTNCYVLGNGELLVVDPGSDEQAELRRLRVFLERRRAEGARPKAIVLTHHHRDHVGGAAELKQDLNIPLWCHPLTAERLSIPAERLLEENEILTLEGAPPMSFRVLHTPGHARGHLTLVESDSQAAIVGDMVAGVGTILIDPPEGEMAVYLRQLDRLRQLPVGTLYPAHGPAIPDGPQKLAEYLEHRMSRERKVLASIGPAGASLEQIVELAYDDVSPLAMAIAARSTEAILIKLVGEGRVIRNRDRFIRTGPTET
jgi:endoribonuclease LACTB2